MTPELIARRVARILDGELRYSVKQTTTGGWVVYDNDTGRPLDGGEHSRHSSARLSCNTLNAIDELRERQDQ